MIDKFKEHITDPDKIRILEAPISPEVLIEYSELADKLRTNYDAAKVLKEAETKLFDKNIPTEEKRNLLILLADIEDVRAFRIIEKYNKNPDEDLKEWSIVAFNESNNLIQNFLLDEDYTLISTGLGGKGDKWRLFVILRKKDGTAFNQKQQQILKKEIEFVFEKNGCILEKLEFGGKYATILALYPMDNTVEIVMDEIIGEVNNFGGFIDKRYLITNVKIIPIEKIENFIKKIETKVKNFEKNPDDFGYFGDIYDEEDFPDEDDDWFDDYLDDEDDDDWDDF